MTISRTDWALFLVAALSAGASLLPVVILLSLQFLSDTTGYDILWWFGTLSEISPQKSVLLCNVIAAAAIISTIALGFLVLRLRSLSSIFLFLLAPLCYLGTYQGVLAISHGRPASIFAALDRIHLHEKFFPEQLRPNLAKMDKSSSSLRIFYAILDAQFQEYADEFSRSWSVTDPLLLKALYLMNVVNGLWPYGHEDPQKAGCVVTHEYPDGSRLDVDQLSLRAYLESPVGCCSDFVVLFNALLRMSGLNPRAVLIPGHWISETTVGGKTWTFDPTSNLAFERAWPEPLLPKQAVTVFSFNHPGLDSKKPAFYRPEIARLRTMMLLMANQVRPPLLARAHEVWGYENVNLE